MKVILEKLLLKLVHSNLQVRISCNRVGNVNGEEGFYDSGRKQIEIFVDIARGWVDASNASTIAQSSTDPLYECLILAHEFGHFLSEKNGCRSAEYERLICMPCQSWPQLSKEEKKIIYAEEMSAWRYGQVALEDLGFTDIRSFNQKKQAALAEYQKRLALTCLQTGLE